MSENIGNPKNPSNQGNQRVSPAAAIQDHAAIEHARKENIALSELKQLLGLHGMNYTPYPNSPGALIHHPAYGLLIVPRVSHQQDVSILTQWLKENHTYQGLKKKKVARKQWLKLRLPWLIVVGLLTIVSIVLQPVLHRIEYRMFYEQQVRATVEAQLKNR